MSNGWRNLNVVLPNKLFLVAIGPEGRVAEISAELGFCQCLEHALLAAHGCEMCCYAIANQFTVST